MTDELPRLDVGLPDNTLRLIGEMMIMAAMIDTQLSGAIGLLEAGPKRILGNGSEGWMVPQRAHHVTSIRCRMNDLRTLSAARNDQHLDHLVTEFRWAMTKVSKTRNFIAHGMLMGGPGEKVFWSQRKLKQMSLKQVLASAPIFRFAWRVIVLITLHLTGIQPPYALPSRPA